MPEIAGRRSAEELYEEAAATFGAALTRLAYAYEPNPDRRRDLLQDVHLALWRSFDRFDGRCSLRTWVYRVAHNTATSMVLRRRQSAPRLIGLDEIVEPLASADNERDLDERRTRERLLKLVQQLKPMDRQVMVLYLEGESAADISEVTGLSPGSVATRVHRIKQLLVARFSGIGGA